MDAVVSFGEWLKQRRQALDLSRRELAECVGCSYSLVEKLELGERNPSRQIAELLAGCLQIAPDERFAFVAFARKEPGEDGPAGEHKSGDTQTPEINLPSPLTPLIGRDDTVACIRDMLISGRSRLVTLTGAPGIGKTRVALQAARSMLADFPGGVYFVALSSIRDPALVVPTIAGVASVADSSGEPVSLALIERLRDRSMLLLLDNFEQVVDAGSGVAEIVSECPHLAVLVTSREPLRVRGEQQLPIEPLGVPDPSAPASLMPALADLGELAQYPAIALFIDRARAVRPDFALGPENAPAVVAICARLNGLPLAIELVAARCKLLSPEALLSMIDSRLVLLTAGPRDLPERHQTLWHAIDSSYKLLTPDEQTLLTRMGVFTGGCTLAAVQAICYPYSDAVDALDVVTSLVDKSLLRREETIGQRGNGSGEIRLTMLEMIRLYAVQRLDAVGEAATVRRHHAEYYLALAEAANPLLSGSEQGLWLAQLEGEHDNLRLALDWALDEGELEIAARLASALRYFWDVRGHLTEGRNRLGRLLEHSAQLSPTLRAEVAYSGGCLAHAQGDLEVAADLLGVSLAIRSELGDRKGVASALSVMGLIAMDRGDFDQAAQKLEMSVGIRRELQDREGTANVLGNLGLLELYRENFDRAVVSLDEALSLYRQIGHKRGISATLTNFAEAARLKGDFAKARSLFVEALGLGRELDAKHVTLACLGGLATVETALRHPLQAARLYGVEEALRREVGAPLPPVDQAEYERCVAEARSQVDEEAFAKAWDAGRAIPLDHVLATITKDE